MKHFEIFCNKGKINNSERNAFIDKVTHEKLPFIEIKKRRKYADIFISLEYSHPFKPKYNINLSCIYNFLDGIIKNQYKKNQIVISMFFLWFYDIDIDIVDEVALKLALEYKDLYVDALKKDGRYPTLEGGF